MTTDTFRRPTVVRAVRAVEAGAPLPAVGDRDELLLALHARWSRQLLSRIDVALELGAETPQASVALAWRSAVRDLPRLDQLLESEADNPALRTARRRLHASVAVAAGLATFDDPASISAAAGAQLLASLAETPDEGGRRPSRLARVLRRMWDGGPDTDPFPWAA